MASAIFAALVAACFAAFFVTQRLKHTPTLVQRFELTPSFSPTHRGQLKLEAISFKLSHAERATVTIVDSAGNDVATLVRDRPLERYKQFSLRWTGRLGVAHSYTLTTTPAVARCWSPPSAGRWPPRANTACA